LENINIILSGLLDATPNSKSSLVNSAREVKEEASKVYPRGITIVQLGELIGGHLQDTPEAAPLSVWSR